MNVNKSKNIDKPLNIDNQIKLMEKQVVLIKNEENDMREFLNYAGYFRVSAYSKYLLSHTSNLREKPNQELLFKVYNFDSELRKLFFLYCKKAEIQIKSHIANAVSLELKDPVFYLNDDYYTKVNDKKKSKSRKQSEKDKYNKFKEKIDESEKKLRKNNKRYPEFKAYLKGEEKHENKIPAWAAFSYFEFGTINNIYKYLRGDLKKRVLIYGYSRRKYKKTTSLSMNTWLDAIKNLRNTCAHHNKLIGRTSSIVKLDMEVDNNEILPKNTDLFSQIYALKKVLNVKDGESLKVELRECIDNAEFDIYAFNILPKEWEELFDRIKKL